MQWAPPGFGCGDGRTATGGRRREDDQFDFALMALQQMPLAASLGAEEGSRAAVYGKASLSGTAPTGSLQRRGLAMAGTSLTIRVTLPSVRVNPSGLALGSGLMLPPAHPLPPALPPHLPGFLRLLSSSLMPSFTFQKERNSPPSFSAFLHIRRRLLQSFKQPRLIGCKPTRIYFSNLAILFQNL